ncbi:hypothetical protein QYE76_008720 [Lolium multiflorum]|uniref:F-box domain-containing protein n=1 Tax=Lolium multiflorum TaxID=4521 RepID=A0AAD8TTY3_LOLMU|nr:hypothetical protein QYE76_008720 [Lolium multiflorum]
MPPGGGGGGGEQGCRELSHRPTTKTKQDQEPHPVGSLPTDVLFGILSRVPYKSLCRFKCVSKPWQGLCSEPDIRKSCERSSQTLSGFFYNDRGGFNFLNLSGRGPPLVDPSLPFLRGSYHHFKVKQCCGGLLLCKCWKSRHKKHKYDYIVCNPMTWKWTVLPPIMLQNEQDGNPVRFEPMDIFLGFEAARPSRFTVFAPLNNYDEQFTEIAIYSSKTTRWTMVESDPTNLADDSESVFLNGTMHLPTDYGSVLTLDAKGEDWGEISMPDHMTCSRRNKPDGGADGGWIIGGGGGGGCAGRVAVAFTFFGGGLPAPVAADGRLDAGIFLLGGARALPGAYTAASCASVALVCSVGRGGTKRARAAAVVLPASASPLGFGAWGGGATDAAAAGGME